MDNPSGGRGSYVLAWHDTGGLCRPTVHDVQLMERIVTLRSVTPATVRRAAREIASQGFAGRAASAEAGTAMAAERESLIATNFQLLLRLVQQEEPPGSVAEAPEMARPAELEQRAKRTIAALAPRLGQDAAVIGSSLEALAALYEPIGLGPRSSPARLPNGIDLLKQLRHEASALPTDTDEAAPMLLDTLITLADVTVTLAEQALAHARQQSKAVVTLLSAWQSHPAALIRDLTQADWLLDGWERICRIWALDPTPAARRDALDEIVGLLPLIPREVGDLAGFDVDFDAVAQLRRKVAAHHDWRTGQCVQDTIGRNEALISA